MEQKKFPPKSYDVSSLGLKCAKCNIDIKELPFQPDPNRAVYCRECNQKRRRSFRRF